MAPASRAALARSLRRLRHDLGKSMSLQLRFAGSEAAADVLAEALRQDVLYTRRGPRGTRSASSLFDEASAWLTGRADLPEGPGQRVDLSDDPDFERLAAAVEALHAERGPIEALAVPADRLLALVALAHDGTAACRALVARYPEAPPG